MSKKILVVLIGATVLVGGGFFVYNYFPEYFPEEDVGTPGEEQDLGDEEEVVKEEEPAGQEPEAEEATSSKKTAFLDAGDFKIVYGETQNYDYANLNLLISNSQVFENLVAFLNQILILQKDFPIIFQQCDTVNAFYNPQEDVIIICDELLQNFAQNFAYFVKSEEELDKAITAATYFILFHELGHGLIDIYDLTYSGKEEDVADQLASVVLINLSEDGAKAAITGANYFYITSSEIGPGFPFWDEHALNQQRYYNILCWVYGSNPQKYNYFVGTYGLPQERAVQCPREYQKMSDFWDITIYPYLQEKIKEQIEQ